MYCKISSLTWVVLQSPSLTQTLLSILKIYKQSLKKGRKKKKECNATHSLLLMLKDSCKHTYSKELLIKKAMHYCSKVWSLGLVSFSFFFIYSKSSDFVKHLYNLKK